MGAKYVGAVVRRLEDPRYLTGRGRFVDDISVAGCLHAAVLDQGVDNPWGIVQPYNTVGHMLGAFRIKPARFDARSVVTNKTPHAPYRGAGRPEAVFVMDRMVKITTAPVTPYPILSLLGKG